MISTRAVLAFLSEARKQWGARGPLVDLPLAMGREGAVAEALLWAREKRRAVEVLYEGDCPAEALRIGTDALQAVTKVIEAAASGDANGASRAARIQSTLKAWGVAPALVERFPQLEAEVLSAPLPASDDRVVAHDLQRLEELLRACLAVEIAFEGVTRTRRQRAGWRVARVTIPLAVGALLGLGLWMISLELKPRVHAHGTWAERISEIGPRFVVDRDPKTEWVAPDGTTGWVELRLFRRQDVRAIVLRNGNNRGLQDRGTRGYQIELYRGKRRLAQAAGSFASIEAIPTPVTVAIQADGVDRVRVLIDSFHGHGATLAEVEIQ